MLKNIAQLEHKIGERTYKFLCDHDSPLGEIHDALAKFKSHVVGIIQTADQVKQDSKESKESSNEQCSDCNN